MIHLCASMYRFARTGAQTMGIKFGLEKSIIQPSLIQKARVCWPCYQIEIWTSPSLKTSCNIPWAYCMGLHMPHSEFFSFWTPPNTLKIGYTMWIAVIPVNIKTFYLSRKIQERKDIQLICGMIHSPNNCRLLFPKEQKGIACVLLNPYCASSFSSIQSELYQVSPSRSVAKHRGRVSGTKRSCKAYTVSTLHKAFSMNTARRPITAELTCQFHNCIRSAL